MRAAYVSAISPDNPVAGLTLGDQPEPAERENWTTVKVAAAALNHHDLWSLKGVGLRAEQLPMILGTDGAGTTPDGTEVVIHSLIGADGHGVGPKEPRTILSEKYPGTLAEYVSVPTANLLPKPTALTWEEAACLPTAYLTAYRMLFPVAQLQPGQRVLVQGVGGGVASAALVLGAAAGLEVFVTSRHEEKRAKALALGAAAAMEPGARVPARVDAVIESVGSATWSHSVKSVKPGGTIAICGATTGDQPGAELTRVFFQEIQVRGVTMGSRADLAQLLNFCSVSGVRPVMDSTVTFDDIPAAFQRLEDGKQFGKIAVTL
jgi:NADPH:quinone reductase-like Zn-dependent oxidoreductase